MGWVMENLKEEVIKNVKEFIGRFDSSSFFSNKEDIIGALDPSLMEDYNELRELANYANQEYFDEIASNYRKKMMSKSNRSQKRNVSNIVGTAVKHFEYGDTLERVYNALLGKRTINNDEEFSFSIYLLEESIKSIDISFEEKRQFVMEEIKNILIESSKNNIGLSIIDCYDESFEIINSRLEDFNIMLRKLYKEYILPFTRTRNNFSIGVAGGRPAVAKKVQRSPKKNVEEIRENEFVSYVIDEKELKEFMDLRLRKLREVALLVLEEKRQLTQSSKSKSKEVKVKSTQIIQFPKGEYQVKDRIKEYVDTASYIVKNNILDISMSELIELIDESGISKSIKNSIIDQYNRQLFVKKLDYILDKIGEDAIYIKQIFSLSDLEEYSVEIYNLSIKINDDEQLIKGVMEVINRYKDFLKSKYSGNNFIIFLNSNIYEKEDGNGKKKLINALKVLREHSRENTNSSSNLFHRLNASDLKIYRYGPSNYKVLHCEVPLCEYNRNLLSLNYGINFDGRIILVLDSFFVHNNEEVMYNDSLSYINGAGINEINYILNLFKEPFTEETLEEAKLLIDMSNKFYEDSKDSVGATNKVKKKK